MADMSVERFLEAQHDQMVARAAREVIGWSADHIPAHSIMRRMAVALALVRQAGGEEAFYTQLHEDMLERLAADGVEAELYKLRGKMTADYETDSRVFLRVTSRHGEVVDVPRRSDILCYPVVLATTRNDVTNKGGE